MVSSVALHFGNSVTLVMGSPSSSSSVIYVSAIGMPVGLIVPSVAVPTSPPTFPFVDAFMDNF